MLDVVTVDVPRERTAGEAAAAIARVQRPSDCGRDGAGPAADVQRLAFLVFDDRDQTGITGEPSDRLRGDCRTLFQLAAPGMVVLQGLDIDMNDDLIAVAARQLLVAGGEVALRDP